MCQYVWSQFQHQQGTKKLQGRVTKKLIGLVWLAAQEVAASRNNDTYQEYAGAALARHAPGCSVVPTVPAGMRWLTGRQTPAAVTSEARTA